MPQTTRSSTPMPATADMLTFTRRGKPFMKLPEITIGCDLGDRSTTMCVLDATGQIVERRTVATQQDYLVNFFGEWCPSRVVMEAGTHSPWISRLATAAGHEVIVANPREVASIFNSIRKNDRNDSEQLARLGRVDPNLLHPIQHRGEDAQELLISIRLRAALVKQRTALILTCRGQTKSIGQRVSGGRAEGFPLRAREELSAKLAATLEPGFQAIEALSKQIATLDQTIMNPPEELAADVARLTQVPGVGPLIALTYILTIDNPKRFRTRRDVGAYLGLCPKQDQSGKIDKQLSISRAGDAYLRTLLTHGAHYILGRFGPDCDLKRFGERLEARGGRAARKRAATAVARKLAVLLHRLWVTGEVYDPFKVGEKPAA